MKIKSGKPLGIQHNVTIRVIDAVTKQVVQEHVGHNMATNSMLLGIAHYLTGDGVLNQGSYMLANYVPRYISLGTMGLISQQGDEDGLPAGIGVKVLDPETASQFFDDPELLAEYEDLVEQLREAELALREALSNMYMDTSDPEHPRLNIYCIPPQYITEDPDATNLERLVWGIESDPCCGCCEDCPCPCATDSDDAGVKDARKEYQRILDLVLHFDEQVRLRDYMVQRPGYGADGYDENENNHREWFGLGFPFANRPEPEKGTINCELISSTFPRMAISFRDIVPEVEAELPMTIDVVYSAMLSTGALKEFRETDRNYLYITECGLWSKKEWSDSGENGLLAAYRIAPPDEWNWYMIGNSIINALLDDNMYSKTAAYSALCNYVQLNKNVYDPDDEYDANEIVDGWLQSSNPVMSLKQPCEDFAQYNRNILKRSIIRVGINQIVQVIWKIQIGSIDQFSTIETLRSNYYKL